MKTQFLIFMISIIMISCGGKVGGNSESTQESEPLALTSAEEALSEKLLSDKSCTQKELLELLVSTPGIGIKTLRKLDHLIEINCDATTGICNFYPKDLK